VKKVGPLSTDLVVACKIYDYQKKNERVEFSKLVTGLKGLVSRSTILKDLETLSDWGIIKTEFGETETGRAGRLYAISGESEELIRETYEKFWEKVLAEKK